ASSSDHDGKADTFGLGAGGSDKRGGRSERRAVRRSSSSALKRSLTRPFFCAKASITERSTEFEVFATSVAQPSAESIPFGEPSPDSWIFLIQSASSVLLMPSTSTSVPWSLPP